MSIRTRLPRSSSPQTSHSPLSFQHRRLFALLFAPALIAALFWLPIPPSSADPPTASVLVTENTTLPLSNQFTMPTQLQLADSGDALFTGGPSALFRWDGSSGVRTRLLQSSDPLLAFPGSVLDTVGLGLQSNAAGHAVMVNNWAQPGTRNTRGLFVYNGSGFQPVALRGDPVPGAPGRVFQNFGSLRINDADQVAFTAVPEPVGSTDQGLFVGSPLGTPVLIALVGDSAPGTGGGIFANFNIVGFNSAGQVAFISGITGGTTSFAIFIATPGNITKVAANGDAAPGTAGTFNLLGGPTFFPLNESGDLAFQSQVAGGGPTINGIWIGNTLGAPVKLIANTDSTGTALGGTFGPSTLRDFNNTGDVLFSSNLVGASSMHALFIKKLSNPAQVVFARNNPAPGGTTEQLFTTIQAAFNDSGQVAFFAQLTGGPVLSGLFSGSGAASPTKIALQGDGAPAGGTFGFGAIIAPQINDSGQVAFFADVLGINAIGAFRFTPGGGIDSIVDTNHVLPPGANPVLRLNLIAASDDHILFGAALAGGRTSYFTKPLKSGNNGIVRIFSEGDAAPGIGGTFWTTPLFGQINNNEEVAFASNRVVGGSLYPAAVLFTHRPGFGLRKVAATGDPAPGGGTIFTFDTSLIGNTTRQINNSGQVAFLASIAGSASASGIFIGSAGGVINPVVRQGGATPIGGNFPIFQFGQSAASVNDAGSVVFQANVPLALMTPAIFIGSGTAPPVKVVARADAGPGGGIFSSLPQVVQFNNAGQVAYVASLAFGSISEGIFLGTAGGPQLSVALRGDPVPGGGTFDDFSPSDIELNQGGQVAFWSGIAGSSATSGYFLGSAVAPPAVRLLEGQGLPGGGAAGFILAFGGVQPGLGFTLNDAGEMSIYVFNVAGTPDPPRMLLADAGGALSILAAPGDKAKGTNSDYGTVLQHVVTNANGRFVGGAILVNGTPKWAFFIDGKN